MARLKNQSLLLFATLPLLWTPTNARSQVSSITRGVSPKRVKQKVAKPDPKAQTPFDLRGVKNSRIPKLKSQIRFREMERLRQLRYLKPSAPEIRVTESRLAVLRQELMRLEQGDFQLIPTDTKFKISVFRNR